MKDVDGAQPGMDFARAIAPMSVEAFFAEYFEKKHLVIRHNDAAYFRDLLSVADIDRVLTEMKIPADDVNMVSVSNPIDKEQFLTATDAIDPVRVAEQFAQGGTVILPTLQRRLPKLATYCRSLETVFSCDLQTNIYMTPDNAQGFKTHYDSHDVVVLQAHGSKTWNIYESPLKLPLRSQSFKPEGFVAGEIIDTFTLHAGDMCYLPRGVVHDAIATNEMSLHITTGLLANRWVDLMIEALVERALEDPALRESVPPGYANHGFDRGPVIERFRSLFDDAARNMDPDQALDGFAHEFRRRRMPVVPGQFLQSVTADEIIVGTTVARRPDLIFGVSKRDHAEEGPQVVLEIYGNEVAFPAFVEETLLDALGRDRFDVGNLNGELDEDGQAVMVRRLVREGVLYRP